MRPTWIIPLVALLLTTSTIALSQTTSNPQAISLAAQSFAALTQGTTVSDVTLFGTATWIVGGDNFAGPVTLKALGATQSRADLNLNGFQRSEIRTVNNGIPAIGWIDASGTHNGAEHNCYTEAAWSFPALWSLWNTSDPTLTATFLGLTTYNSLSAQHLHFIRTYGTDALLNGLSATDVFLDPTTALPLAITFQAHPDTNALSNLPVEVRFANYQNVNGVMVPFRIQKLQNGSLMLDVTVQSATINSGLSAADFTI
jgi:hypothetical protein